MAKWIPNDIEWFLAEVVQQFTFGNGDPPSVWVNTLLIKASSLEEGYEKAMVEGKRYDDDYLNSDGVEVKSRFRGLRDLLLIYETLEHGAEVLWQEFDDLTEEQIEGMITPKKELGAFITHGPEDESTSEPNEVPS